MKNKKKLIVRMVLIVIVSVMIGLFIYRLNSVTLTGDKMPMPFGFGVGVVVSGSMEPELSVDDVIFVTRASDYAVGDVVVFQARSALVVHKIISIDGETVVTQGTANNTPDDPMDISEIKGKVAFHIDGLGKVVSVIKSPICTIVILLAAAFLLVLSYKNEKKADDDELSEIRREIERLKNETGIADPSVAEQNTDKGHENDNINE